MRRPASWSLSEMLYGLIHHVATRVPYPSLLVDCRPFQCATAGIHLNTQIWFAASQGHLIVMVDNGDILTMSDFKAKMQLIDQLQNKLLTKWMSYLIIYWWTTTVAPTEVSKMQPVNLYKWRFSCISIEVQQLHRIALSALLERPLKATQVMQFEYIWSMYIFCIYVQIWQII